MHTGFLVVIGLGNIGSHLVSALAALPFLRRVLLVDFDHYQRSNLGSQMCVASDEGSLKTAVQAPRLSALNPRLKVETMAVRLEKLPLGIFHQADWVVSGLDSRLARIRLNERIFNVGKTAWIDAGVDGESGLARASVFPAGTGETTPQVCFECSLSNGDYRMSEVPYLCSPVSQL
ncbi:MAG: ThiF family adenylyltransferase, partial [Verrucomicrobiales bacterium]